MKDDLKSLQQRLSSIEDEIEGEARELEAQIEKLEALALTDNEFICRAKQLLADSHTEYLCWPEISALETLLASPTIALFNRVRQILGNHGRLFSPITITDTQHFTQTELLPA